MIAMFPAIEEKRKTLSSDTHAWQLLMRFHTGALTRETDTAGYGISQRQTPAKQKNGYKTVEQVAHHVGLSARTVRHHIETDRLPAEKIGRAWFVKDEDLATYTFTTRRI